MNLLTCTIPNVFIYPYGAFHGRSKVEAVKPDGGQAAHFCGMGYGA